ncbi:hypothetical protein F7725_015269 [Dissostichus mawsoni]|uniref:Uncharacterized protein n=1 Tax=Dissostichus mawsoni TaxID=36200 RepID=A0A7J5YGZ8_DISMA|nr:hypothetical protein F7725_015269 [Dissostichus mawsoni]
MILHCFGFALSSAMLLDWERMINIGGTEMENPTSQVTLMRTAALLGVLFFMYSMGSVIAQYLSKAMAHRWRMDEVQHKTSREMKMSHGICPSVRVLLLEELSNSGQAVVLFAPSIVGWVWRACCYLMESPVRITPWHLEERIVDCGTASRSRESLNCECRLLTENDAAYLYQ